MHILLSTVAIASLTVYACTVNLGHVGNVDLVCACGLESTECSNKELTEGRRDLGRGAREVKEKCVCRRTHTHTHLVVWSWGTSALVRVTGNERLVGLKNITTATASHNPIPSHPTQELCATWLACSPWGTEATAQALSAYSLCQLWFQVCGQGASSTLKERLAHFGRRRCELCRRTPTVCVSLCVVMPVCLHGE